jgi:hypothetical protein
MCYNNSLCHIAIMMNKNYFRLTNKPRKNNFILFLLYNEEITNKEEIY